MDYIVQADPSSQVEVQGLSAVEPSARPGDIFTRAATPNRDAAVDVTICSQEAAYAGGDCVRSAFNRKAERYAHVIVEWESTGMQFLPMVWSHEGRAHPVTQQIMTFCCSLIARRHGGNAKAIKNRWASDIGVILARRRARMAMRCMPRSSARSQFILHGDAEAGVHDHHVLLWHHVEKELETIG
eukprot:12414399-Karenia_brevis.AAC.1